MAASTPAARASVQFDLKFVVVISSLMGVAALIHGNPVAAMWFGFALAAYSAIANDTIQTLGTFIASNPKSTWVWQWLFMGGIFVATTVISFVLYDGDVSHERLTSRSWEKAPTSFTFLQLAAPIILLVLTRLKMPVSTSFLLLSCFADSSKGIVAMTLKSVGGYGIAFVTAIVIWFVFEPMMTRRFKGPVKRGWYIAQWIATGFLWSVWLMQDMANIAVFLPRSLSLVQLAIFTGVIFFALGFLFRQRGEAIQEVVDEKENVSDVRSATIIVFVYGLILYFFKVISKIPMSTTWVFIGLLAGRELAFAIRRRRQAGATTTKEAGVMIFRDLVKVLIGFVVSLILAVMINDHVRDAVVGTTPCRTECRATFTTATKACKNDMKAAKAACEAKGGSKESVATCVKAANQVRIACRDAARQARTQCLSDCDKGSQ